MGITDKELIAYLTLQRDSLTIPALRSAVQASRIGKLERQLSESEAARHELERERDAAIALADALERALTAERQLEHDDELVDKFVVAFEKAVPTIAYRPVVVDGHVIGYSWQVVDYPPSPEVLAVDPQDRED